jgi:hypothetical protein
MNRAFTAMALVLLAAIAGTAVHYLRSDRGKAFDALYAITALTGHSTPSRSCAWYEPRLPSAEPASNPDYPELMPIDRMDFVYAY